MPVRVAHLGAMGVTATALVLLADFTVGLSLRGIGALEQLQYLATPAGLIYAAALALFAGMPIIANRAWKRP